MKRVFKLALCLMLLAGLAALGGAGGALAEGAGYTVEFGYGDLEYVLPGDTSAPLAAVLDALGLSGEVTAVEISDTSLFSASDETGEWIVTALQPFSTTEWMKVTINGVAYEITVTDTPDTNGIELIQPTGGTVGYEIKNYMGDNRFFLSNTTNEGYRFKEYRVKDENGNEVNLSYTMNLDGSIQDWYFNKPAGTVTITAEFEYVPYYGITVTQTTGGTVTAGKASAHEGERVSLSYTEDSGYLFRGFTVTKADGGPVEVTDTSSDLNQHNWGFSMPAEAVTVTAVFAAAHAITVQQPEHGTIQVASSAVPGDNVEFLIVVELGITLESRTVYKSDDPSVTVAVTGGLDSCSFTMPDYPVTISPTTSGTPLNKYNVTCHVDGGHGVIKGENPQSYSYETLDCIFEIRPDSGYILDTLTVDGNVMATIVYGVGMIFQFAMPSHDVEITVSFKAAETDFSVENNTVTLTPYADTNQLSDLTLYITNDQGMSSEHFTVDYDENLNPFLLDSNGEKPNDISVSENDSSYVIKVLRNIPDIQFSFQFNRYTIRFPNATNGVDGVSNPNLTYGTVAANHPLQPASKQGSVFLGWYRDADFTDGPVTVISGNSVQSGSIDLYARWETGYTITYENLFDDMETTGYPVGYVSSEGAALPVAYHRGHNFLGWYDNQALSGDPMTAIPVNSTGDRTFWAKWEAIDYSVSVAAATHGTLSADKSTAHCEDTVTLTVAPAEGYLLDSLSYTPAGGEAQTITADANGKYTFSMPPADVTVSASFVPDPAHFSANDAGTEYTIKTATGWGVFCDCLMDNDTWNRFSGKTVKLGASIAITRMAGSSGHDFCGIFNGDGHTITIDSSSGACAVFSHVSTTKADPNDAEETASAIKNLRVTGTINTSAKYAAGLISQMWGNVTIENCRSSVIINSGVSGDGTHGGFVAASNGTVTINGCVFDGKLLTTGDTTCCGGFVGWGGATVTNSLYAPAAIGDNETEVQEGTSYPSATFVRNGSAGDNCYYTRALGTAQGKHPLTVAAGEYVTVSTVSPIGDATHTYSVSGITAYANGITRGETFYYGSGDDVSLTLAHSDRAGYTFASYTASAGALDDTTLTLPDEDVTVSASYTANTYTVSFNANGGTGDTMTAQGFTYDEAAKALTANTYTRMGHDFAGWATEANGAKVYDDEENVSNLTDEAGGTVTLYAVWTPTAPIIKGHVLQLNGVLGLKFYVELPEDFDPAGSKMTFTLSGSTQTVSFDAERMEYGCYYFPCRVKSFQMADSITAAYIWGDGEDERVTETYSVQDYLAYFNKHADDYPAAVVDLARAIQNYGHYVQPYLAKANHWTVGTDHAQMPKYSDVNTSVDASAYALSIPVKTVLIAESHYSLSLDANTALNLYLKLNDDSVTALTAQIDDKTPFGVARRSDGYFRVTCSGIEANNLGKFYLFTVKNGEETVFQANISALSFVNTVLNKQTHTDDTEVPAVCALYRYAQAADAYAKSIQ